MSKRTKTNSTPPGYKAAISLEAFIALAVLVLIFIPLGHILGATTLIRTMFDIAFDLLINTCFFIMAIAVLAGALSAVLTEFGILSLVNQLLSPLMRPIYGLPGAAAIGIVTTFLSDNPAILTLCADKRFSRLFRRKELPALCNLGTAFGMGLIVIAFMLGLNQDVPGGTGLSVTSGLLGAVVGSIISTRLMIRACSKKFGDAANDWVDASEESDQPSLMHYRQVREGSVMRRLFDALLEGGKSGVDIGLAIIPGVLIICTLVLILTHKPDDIVPGVGLIPQIGQWLNFILQPLFGFSSPEAISVPLTALGSAGAAIALIPDLVQKSAANGNDIAVFTAMCMCWSGYLSTHVAMMDALHSRELTGSAILSHTIGGFAAGIAAHLFYLLFTI